MMPQHHLPADIERTSMKIITGELAQRGLDIPPENAPVVKRVIHTTADFDYAQTLHFTPGAVAAGIAAMHAGATIITDTNMALAGITKPGLANLFIVKDSQDQKYNGIIKLQIHPVIPSRTGQLNHSIFLVYLKAIAKNAQIFFKFFPVFQHKIIICFGILVSFAQKAGSQKTVANPAEIILFFLQHSFQIFHFLSSVSENL